MPEETLENPEGADTQALNELAEEAKTDAAAAAAAWNELVAQARPLLLRDFNGKVCLESGWPEVVAIAPVLLEQEDLFAVDDQTNLITITLGNARAVYRYAGMDGEITIARLPEDYTAPPAEEPMVETPADPVAEQGETAAPAADPLAEIPEDKIFVEQVELKDGGPAQAMLYAPHGDKGWMIVVKVIRGGKQYGQCFDVTGAVHGFNDPQVTAAKRALVTEVEAFQEPGAAALPVLEAAEPVTPKPAAALANEKRAGITQEPPAADPNVKCPECKMYGNRHKRGCSRAD